MSDAVTRSPSELDALRATLSAMPPVVAMGVSVVAYDGACLQLSAPLARNLNDKGSAFGGSLTSLKTLAAWGLVTLRLREAGQAAEVYVADSQVRYCAPLYGDLHADARLAEGADWDAFLAQFVRRGRARLALTSCVHDAAGTAVSTLDARFAALAVR